MIDWESILFFIYLMAFAMLIFVGMKSCEQDAFNHEKWNKCMEITKDVKQCEGIGK